jgi:hypothetical protein
MITEVPANEHLPKLPASASRTHFLGWNEMGWNEAESDLTVCFTDSRLRDGEF